MRLARTLGWVAGLVRAAPHDLTLYVVRDQKHTSSIFIDHSNLYNYTRCASYEVQKPTFTMMET